MIFWFFMSHFSSLTKEVFLSATALARIRGGSNGEGH